VINWRKPVLKTIYYLARNPTLRNLSYLQSIELQSPEKLQQKRLERLLLHAYLNVPYYQDLLQAAGVVKNNSVLLEKFYRIPLLTKEILRKKNENLYSKDYKKRGFYVNHTGGSTGEPVKFIQDKFYKAWGMAHLFYANQMCGLQIGEPVLKLWGSERDVFRRSEKPLTRLERWLSNTIILNGFLMSEEQMHKYLNIWSKFKPKAIIAYTSSILEFARYVKLTGKTFSRPQLIMCCAETLTEDVRKYIEDVFGCPAINYYGARDGGAIACECLKKEGLHIFELNNKVEIVNSQGLPAEPGQIGDIVITTLNNFSMPLIRYKIGDTAIPAENSICPCGRGWPRIKKLTGRKMEIFRTKDGTSVPGEFFIHAIGVVYNRDFIKKFQAIQKDFEHIIIKLVLTDRKQLNKSKEPLVEAIKKVMGADCKVEFEIVDNIEPTPSGKFQYTICEIA